MTLLKFWSSAKKEPLDFGSWSNNSVKRLKFRRLTEKFDQVKMSSEFRSNDPLSPNPTLVFELFPCLKLMNLFWKDHGSRNGSQPWDVPWLLRWRHDMVSGIFFSNLFEQKILLILLIKNTFKEYFQVKLPI
jgi:hypothetical protein